MEFQDLTKAINISLEDCKNQKLEESRGAKCKAEGILKMLKGSTIEECNLIILELKILINQAKI